MNRFIFRFIFKVEVRVRFMRAKISFKVRVEFMTRLSASIRFGL